MDKKIGVVILNYNNYADTISCVESTLTQKRVYKIIIVDNGSSNNSFDILNKKYSDIEKIDLIKNSTNIGYAKGNNVGIDHLVDKGCNYIFIANSDIYFTSSDIVSMLADSDEENVGILIPIIKNLDGTIEQRVAYKKKFFLLRMIRYIIRTRKELKNSNIYPINQNDLLIQNDYRKRMGFQKDCYIVSGSGFMLTPKFIRIYSHLFPETFLYGEEWATMIYLHKAGLSSKIVDTPIIVHKGAGSTPKGESQNQRKKELKYESSLQVKKLLFLSKKSISKKYGRNY